MDHNLTLTENDTFIDDNPFLDSDESIYYSDTLVHQTIEVFNIIGVLIRLAAGALCLASDIYLIVIMSKFKNLRTRINKYILLYAIFNLCYMLLSEILLLIAREVFGIWGRRTYYVFKSLDHFMMTLTFYVLTLMVVEWYVYNYHDGFYKRHTNLFKYGIVIVISLAIPKWFINTLSCFVTMWSPQYVRFILEGFSFIISLTVVLTITVLKNKQTPLPDAYKTEYVVLIARTVLLCFLPLYIIWIIDQILRFEIEYLTIGIQAFLLTEHIGSFFSYMASVFVLYKLTKINKYFKVAYLKCCKKNVNDYTDEDLVDSDSLQNVQVKNVTYDRQTDVVNI